jgi:hypothetical protein
VKLNTGQAWADATRMIGTNREVVAAIAGVFFFLPFLVLMLLLFGADIDFGGPNAQANPELIAQQINAVLYKNWWALLLVVLMQLAGAIALVAVLAERTKPTVGQALGLIPTLILTMIAAQLLTAVATQALPYVASALPPAAQSIASLILLPITLYIAVKLSLASIVIVVERERNPITALKRSWQLTKGNSLTIFFFYLLIVIAVFVIGLVAAISVGLVLALLGDRTQLTGTAIIISALVAAYYAVSYAVAAAIHRRLAGPTEKEVANTFE